MGFLVLISFFQLMRMDGRVFQGWSRTAQGRGGTIALDMRAPGDYIYNAAGEGDVQNIGADPSLGYDALAVPFHLSGCAQRSPKALSATSQVYENTCM